jgi:hypothetical protein
MTIRAEQNGRRLVLTLDGGEVDGIMPFTIAPVSARTGNALTNAFILLATQVAQMPTEQVEAMYKTCLDGGTVSEDGLFVPVSPTPIYDRVSDELSSTEAIEFTHKAFMWQSIVGIEGITVHDEAGGGVNGMVKSLRLLTDKLGLSPSLTSRSTESAPQTPAGATPPTTTHPSIALLDEPSSTVSKLPPNKVGHRPKQSPTAQKST